MTFSSLQPLQSKIKNSNCKVPVLRMTFKVRGIKWVQWYPKAMVEQTRSCVLYVNFIIAQHVVQTSLIG